VAKTFRIGIVFYKTNESFVFLSLSLPGMHRDILPGMHREIPREDRQDEIAGFHQYASKKDEGTQPSFSPIACVNRGELARDGILRTCLLIRYKKKRKGAHPESLAA
jgi:hypothetical protein